MIVVTGGTGFIGSAVVWELNQRGKENILIVDDLGEDTKWKNLRSLRYLDFIQRVDFAKHIANDDLPDNISAVVHLGDWENTAETDAKILTDHNYNYSKLLANYCLQKHIRFIYASCASTYGSGHNGFFDIVDELDELRPKSLYAYSKHMFDLWLKRQDIFHRVTGLKIPQVYGPNEYHRPDPSIVLKVYNLLKNQPTFMYDVEELSNKNFHSCDYIYIKDVARIIDYFITHPHINGLFNVSNGYGVPAGVMIKNVYEAMKLPLPDYINAEPQNDLPALDIAGLKEANYKGGFTNHKEAIREYIQDYLQKGRHLGDEK